MNLHTLLAPKDNQLVEYLNARYHASWTFRMVGDHLEYRGAHETSDNYWSALTVEDTNVYRRDYERDGGQS